VSFPAAVPAPTPLARREGLKVFVRGLTVEAGIGVYDHEHGRLQTLIIDVTLDLGPAEVHGLADTINYETVATACRRIVSEGHVGLVETFAERLALDCLLDPRVLGVTVRIEKPGALEAAAAAGCELTYRR
jgi:dihydroneopterin aldolase